VQTDDVGVCLEHAQRYPAGDAYGNAIIIVI
jgi:hypothetical protein